MRVKERFPDVWTPGRSDLCFATTNRQAAIEELAHRSDVIIVIGSANSSNTRALEKLARADTRWVTYMGGRGERDLLGTASYDLGKLGAQLQRQGFKLHEGTSDVEVLIESDDLKERYGVSSVAVTFRFGKGRVLHMLGHIYQMEGNLKGTFSTQRMMANFLLAALRKQ